MKTAHVLTAVVLAATVEAVVLALTNPYAGHTVANRAGPAPRQIPARGAPSITSRKPTLDRLLIDLPSPAEIAEITMILKRSTLSPTGREIGLRKLRRVDERVPQIARLLKAGTNVFDYPGLLGAGRIDFQPGRPGNGGCYVLVIGGMVHDVLFEQPCGITVTFNDAGIILNVSPPVKPDNASTFGSFASSSSFGFSGDESATGSSDLQQVSHLLTSLPWPDEMDHAQTALRRRGLSPEERLVALETLRKVEAIVPQITRRLRPGTNVLACPGLLGAGHLTYSGGRANVESHYFLHLGCPMDNQRIEQPTDISFYLDERGFIQGGAIWPGQSQP